MKNYVVGSSFLSNSIISIMTEEQHKESLPQREPNF